jgi:hypothetical protein
MNAQELNARINTLLQVANFAKKHNLDDLLSATVNQLKTLVSF